MSSELYQSRDALCFKMWPKCGAHIWWHIFVKHSVSQNYNNLNPRFIFHSIVLLTVERNRKKRKFSNRKYFTNEIANVKQNDLFSLSKLSQNGKPQKPPYRLQIINEESTGNLYLLAKFSLPTSSQFLLQLRIFHLGRKQWFLSFKYRISLKRTSQRNCETHETAYEKH